MGVFGSEEVISGDLHAEADGSHRISQSGNASVMEQEHLTEAACLLKQGALYRKRIGLERIGVGGDPIFAGFKAGAFSLYFGDAPIYHFDLEGRWQRAFVEGIHYLKGLDAEVQAIDRVREGPNLVLHRRRLGDAETGDLDGLIRGVALELLADLDAGRLMLQSPPSGKAEPLGRDELDDFLGRIGRWDTPPGWPTVSVIWARTAPYLSCLPTA